MDATGASAFVVERKVLCERAYSMAAQRYRWCTAEFNAKLVGLI
jgi:hypothetical protein